MAFDVNDCLSKYAEFGKNWRLVTSGDLNFGLEKYDPNSFERTLYELSNKVLIDALKVVIFRYDVWSPPHDSEPIGARQEQD